MRRRTLRPRNACEKGNATQLLESAPSHSKGDSMQLDQVKAVVTGGASGLGFAVAKHLAAHGAQGRAARRQRRERQRRRRPRSARSYFRADVTNEEGVVATLKDAHAKLGGLNVLVNCAGILGSGRVLGKEGPMPLKTFATTVTVNLIGTSTSPRPRRT